MSDHHSRTMVTRSCASASIDRHDDTRAHSLLLGSSGHLRERGNIEIPRVASAVSRSALSNTLPILREVTAQAFDTPKPNRQGGPLHQKRYSDFAHTAVARAGDNMEGSTSCG
jgi:hypothetical protein